MGALQQMNIRIAPRLKQQGDAILARMGRTPSEGIRCFYEFLVRNQNDAEALDSVIDSPDLLDEREQERARKLKTARDLPRMIAQRCTALGIEPREEATMHRTKADDRADYIEAIAERYAERGLL